MTGTPGDVTGTPGDVTASAGAVPPRPGLRRPRVSEESAFLLRAALVLALVLGLPTFGALVASGATSAWTATASVEIRGDSWDGNLASDGTRVYLMTREAIAGFWGVLYVRSSADHGLTWGEPVQVSAAGGPSAARHALTVAADGSLWAAWAQAGASEGTQELVLRRSRDGGRFWDAPIRASSSNVGVVGIPALVMTAEARFVAFTDGARGTVYVQDLDADGAPSGDPAALRSTRRTLYDDSSLLDAGVSAAAIQGRAVLVMHDGADLWRYQRPAPGGSWSEEPWYTFAAFAAPRVVAVDGGFMALTAVPTADDVVQISADSSSDAGQTWGSVAAWHDPAAGSAVLAASSDGAFAIWESCGGGFCEPALRMADIDAATGRSERIAGETGRSAGAVLAGDRLVVAWVREGESFEPEDRTLVVATGPRP